MTDLPQVRPPARKSLELLRDRLSSGWLAGAVAVLGAAVYALQAWGHSSGQASVLDEGLYLYKGLLYASGRYWPFQDFGPWTNHMPLSFLIPGWVQLVTEPGLRTGRTYALVLAALLLLAVWILGRRLGGGWPAAAAVAALGFNPFLIKIYSQAISQVLVAAILAWALVLTLGPGRRPWQIALGGFLLGALAMTRVNLLPALPLLVGYIFWEHGRRPGWIAAGAGATVVILGHAILWPGILKLWAYWLPSGLSPFLDPWRELSQAQRFWDPQFAFGTRFSVFLSGLRLHLLPFLGVLLTAILWPGRTGPSRWQRKAAGILLLLFGALLAVHAWASLANNYCVFCYPLYLAFFSFTGVLLLALALGRWVASATHGRRIAAGLAAVLVGLVARTSTLERTASQLLSTQLPRMKELRLLPGTASLEVLLANRFGFPPVEQVRWLTTLLAIWLGLLITGGILLLAAWLLRRPAASRLLPGVATLGAAWLLGLTLAHGNTFRNYDCGTDVIASYEAVGQHLRRFIPEDAHVYWAGGLSPVPLLYLPHAQIYPAQLNVDYSFRIGGDPASLSRFGFWNQGMAESWLKQADYALIEARELSGWLTEALASGAYEELAPTPLAVNCRADSAIHIFRRVE